MQPIRLYIEDFMCHENSFIDFTQFRSALIVGKIENNDLYSNGVGKTTIFKAIEYVLFNQADVNLEKIIREDTLACKIVLDFIVDNKEYRLSRTRTKKSTDLSLFIKNENSHNANINHEIVNKFVIPTINDSWKDISSRRAADTERDLFKLIKFTFKSFRNIIHFPQNIFDGLASTTPEKRKGILKDVLDLIIYSKMEKITKDKSNFLLKEIDKTNILINNLNNPSLELNNFKINLIDLSKDLEIKNNLLKEALSEVTILNDKINVLSTDLQMVEGNSSSLLAKESVLTFEKTKIDISVKEYTSKKNNIIKVAKDLINEVALLKEKQAELLKINYDKIDLFTSEVNAFNTEILNLNSIIKLNLLKIEDLSIPLPNDDLCKHCRQPMTKEHRKVCQNSINNELKECKLIVSNTKAIISKLVLDITEKNKEINSLNLSKQKLEDLNLKISSLNKDIKDKKDIHTEYSSLLNKFTEESVVKNIQIIEIKQQIENSSIAKANKIKDDLNSFKQKVISLNENISNLRNDTNSLYSKKAVVDHNIIQKTNDLDKLEEYKANLQKLLDEYSIFPSVIKAFSSTGIPNLIIQNVLDDLQIEANNLLAQLKPGLQLSFSIEKTKADGTEVDTLDINYSVNGKDRYYEQLSGAMRLVVAFSLKLGLSFILQKIIGVDIKFLLLDEIDQALDKASVDAFADIVKFFQKDFMILIITHNDRLKDKFAHAILVEQDINMISKASVVTSW